MFGEDDEKGTIPSLSPCDADILDLSPRVSVFCIFVVVQELYIRLYAVKVCVDVGLFFVCGVDEFQAVLLRELFLRCEGEQLSEHRHLHSR